MHYYFGSIAKPCAEVLVEIRYNVGNDIHENNMCVMGKQQARVCYIELPGHLLVFYRNFDDFMAHTESQKIEKASKTSESS